MSGLNFLKMHGLGNDFVIIDGRAQAVALDAEQAQAIADRHTGVGCDQVIVIEPPHHGGDAFMRIRNADGGEVAACGNATRAVAALLMTEMGRDSVRIETLAGTLAAEGEDDGQVTVDMGEPALEWQGIPLALPEDTLHLPISEGPLCDAVAVGMGNPHAVFFVDDLDGVDLARHGPVLETDRLFPERANIGVARVLDAGHLRLRVWERGAGITLACGTGACAAAVAAHRRGLTLRDVAVELDGGVLHIHWRTDGHVMMTGPATISFRGSLENGLAR